jgi:hypothetical protein
MSSQHGEIQTEDWPEDLNQPYSQNWEHMEFNGDGLNTGVQVLGMYSQKHIKPLTNWRTS